MTSPRPGKDSNPFLELLARSVEPDVTVAFMSLPNALWKPFDVLHVQWVESLTRGATMPRRAAKLLLSSILLARVLIRRRPVVRTLHNLAPHDGADSWERVVFRLFEALENARIFLNESDENHAAEGIVILHGAYETSESDTRADLAADRRIITFGALRPYKGIESLIATVRELSESVRVTLEIIGRPVDEDYGQSLQQLIREHSNVTLRSEFLPDAQLEAEIVESELVVLPYRQLYNSGAALFALSVGRPILVPRTGSTVTLQKEVGKKWVHLFDDDLTGKDILGALNVSSMISQDDKPDLSRRQWQDIGQLHVSVYRALCEAQNIPRNMWRDYLRRHVATDKDFLRHSTRNGEF